MLKLDQNLNRTAAMKPGRTWKIVLRNIYFYTFSTFGLMLPFISPNLANVGQ